jgi:secreted protein with Ig-like and vWFA domain
MNQPPFDTVGDAPVEARIVAWVLGEASAFEAAELERLCEERPELLVFRRRMRALHGLLTEAEAAEPDHSWKLPIEKRKILDEIFGKENVTRLEPPLIRPEAHKERSIRRSGRRALLAIAACLALTLFITRLLPWKHEAEAIIEVRPRVSTTSALGGDGGPTSAPEKLTPQFFGTEFGKIKSRSSLEKVVDNLDLAKRWNVDKESAIERVKDSIETKTVSGTDLMSIRVRDASERDAQEITQEVVQAYKNYRRSIEERDSDKALWELNKAVRDQEDKVEERRKVLATIVRTKGVIYKGQDSFYGQSGVDEEGVKDDSREDAIKRGLDAQDYVDAKRDFETDQKLLQAMRLKQIGRSIADKMPDETVIVHEMTPKVEMEKSMPALVQLADAPAAPSDGTYRLESKSMSSNRELGMQKTKEQSMLAKHPAKPASEAVASLDVASSQLPPPAESSPVKSLPPIASSGLTGAGEGRSSGGMGGGIRPTGRGVDAPETPAAALQGEVFWSSADESVKLKNTDAKPEVLAGKNVSPDATGWAGAPIRTSSASTHAHTEPVDQMRRTLYTADGNLNLGKYDEAKNLYEDALKIDPENSDARRGIERVEGAKSESYRASNDHSRAELLSQVDSAWELTVPASVDAPETEIVREFKYPTEFEPPAPADEPLPEEEAKLLADLSNEIPAAETPYSTFSLNISDASFQLAKAALAKGERPDPASIKLEQFYNAVDYGDPAPTSNEPVAATIEQSAHPVIPGRNLVRVALRTGSVGRSTVQPLRLTLLVDQSGSMVREDRRASMEHALAQLGVLLTKDDLVTVIGFSRTPHLLADGMSGDQATKLSELVNQTASEGGTNLEEAMKLGGQLAERHQLVGAQNRIVLFTDGAANLGDANPVRLAEQVKAFRQNGLAFDIAGIGADGLNDRLLSELARNGNGRYYVVGNEKDDSFARQLAGAFRPAAENVKVQVDFNPQRVGKYKLIGFEKDRLKTEDFRNDAVDAAELAAEEAGVAIYQVETLPEGTGELGEVSVRFRDMKSGEMVERTWSMPYDAQATAFDRATPSMQLSGLSMLAAEKLRGGPLADAIDFNQLTGPGAFVKQFYGSSPRVADMLRVIDALK